MGLDFQLLFSSTALGIGLSMDAFSASLVNGMNSPKMRRTKMCFTAFVFAFLQGLMPSIGYICVHTVTDRFEAFQKFVPFIALILLLYIGFKMILSGMKVKADGEAPQSVNVRTILVQGIATSIDALSVGFTISAYTVQKVLICVMIIAVVTFFICLVGIAMGKRVGTRMSGKASVLGGAILVLIGIEIFVAGMV